MPFDPGCGILFPSRMASQPPRSKLPAAPISLKTAQIGRCGELLVQYYLLRRGVESAAMTTDSGVDLVAYSAKSRRPLTIQVKTNLAPKPAGGKGKPALDWWIPDDCPADLVALVDLSEQRVWIFLPQEVSTLSQQHSNGRYHLCMYSDPEHQIRKAGKLMHVTEYEKFLLPNRADGIF